jgi:hypothetical protein
VAQLYPRALGSLYVVSYDSQSYGGGVLTFPIPRGTGPCVCIYTSGIEWFSPKSSQCKSQKSRYDRRPVNQYVLVSSPLGIKGVPSEKFQFDIRRCTLRRNFSCYHWEGCMRSMQCNVKFGYQLSICSGTAETRGKPWVGRLQGLPDAVRH